MVEKRMNGKKFENELVEKHISQHFDSWLKCNVQICGTKKNLQQYKHIPNGNCLSMYTYTIQKFIRELNVNNMLLYFKDDTRGIGIYNKKKFNLILMFECEYKFRKTCTRVRIASTKNGMWCFVPMTTYQIPWYSR